MPHRIKPAFNSLPPLVQFVLITALSFLLYYFFALVGLQLATLNSFSSPVWPAAGVAACLVYTLGPQAALGIFLGAFLANYYNSVQLGPSFFIGIGNTTSALVGVYLFNFLMRFKDDYGLHARSIFVVFTIGISVIISASVGTATLYFFEIISGKQIFNTWFTWWIGDAIGALFIIPFIYKIYANKFYFSIFKQNLAHIVAILFVATFINFVVFNTTSGPALLFTIFLPLLLAGLFLHSTWIYVLSIYIGVWAVVATLYGHGPFHDNSVNENLVHLQLFLLGLGITALGLTSLYQDGLRRRTVITFVGGWIVSGIMFFSLFNLNHELDDSRFASRAEQAQFSIESKFKNYIALLESGVAFFNASQEITREEWREFTQLALKNRSFASIESLAVAIAAKDSTIEKPSFPITYIEPIATKHRLVGFDLASEPNRLAAAVRARDSGMAAATNVINLKTDNENKPALLLYSPFYKRGAPVDTVENRRKAFIGFIFAPMVIETFINNAISKFDDEVHMTLNFDSSEGGPGKVVYVSPEKISHSHHNSLVKKTVLAGQPATIFFNRSSGFQATSGLVFSLISFLGALVTLLAAIIVSSLQSTVLRAQEIAEEKTKEVVEKNRIWKVLTETAPVGIYLADKDGKCTYVNSTWSLLTGLSLGEACGAGWIESIHHDDAEMVRKCWSDLLNGGSFDCHYRFLHEKDNSIVYVHGKALPLKNSTGEIESYLGIIQDMTDSVKKNNALAASSRMSSLGEMASGIAHEVNNPLSIILGNADLLASHIESPDFDRDKAQNYLRQMINTVHRIAKIVRGLRAFARETTRVPFEVCKIHDVVNDTLELCRERFISHKVELMLPARCSDDIRFLGRPEQMTQVLLNLLNNAFDAAIESDDKWVRVTCELVGRKIQIQVSDSGPGIKPALLEKIFEPFFTSKEVGKGTGLGLSVSKGIVEYHKGSIFVDTSAPVTTFVVELPQTQLEVNRGLDFV